MHASLTVSRAAPPVPLTALFGRDAEAIAVRDLVLGGRRRLVTLTGPGGVGKTRLALRVAALLRDHVADGVAFASLAAAADEAALPAAIAEAIGLGPASSADPATSTLDRLIAVLRDRRLLLVLDNLETVLDAAPLLSTLLARGPSLVILATSRVRLRLSDEQEFVVSPLGLPEEGAPLAAIAAAPAVALFVDRASAARPRFTLTDANASAIADVVRRLDGLPLAIELAAARIAHLPPAALRDRLATDDLAALRLLTSGARDAPTRHQTLRAAIAWSHDLLAPEEQTLFRRLAVFADGFSLEAAEAVAQGTGDGGRGTGDSSRPVPLPLSPVPSVFDGIAALVDAHLVDVQPTDGAAEPRYALLQTIREYALELLAASGEAEATWRRLAAWLIWLDRERGPVPPAEHAARVAAVEAELANVRAATAWALARGDAETAINLVRRSPWYLWAMRGRLRDEERWLARALELAAHDSARIDPETLGHGLSMHAMHFLEIGEHREARARLEPAIRLLRDAGNRIDLAVAVTNLASVHAEQSEFDDARRLYGEAVAIWRELGNPARLLTPLTNLCMVALRAGDLEEAELRLAEASAFVSAGSPRQAAYVVAYRGVLALQAGRGDEAQRLLAEAQQRFANGVDARGYASMATTRALGLAPADPAGAAALLSESLAWAHATGDRTTAATALQTAAGIVARIGLPAEAARLLGAAGALLVESGGPRYPAERADWQSTVAALRAALGGEKLAAAESAGARLPLTAAIEEAIDLIAAVASIAPLIPSAPTGPLAALTEREREILAFLADGLTDPEIADRLSLSPRTVSNHVGRILAKLDVPTRTAAAVIALRDGIHET